MPKKVLARNESALAELIGLEKLAEYRVLHLLHTFGSTLMELSSRHSKSPAKVSTLMAAWAIHLPTMAESDCCFIAHRINLSYSWRLYVSAVHCIQFHATLWRHLFMLL